VAFRWSTHWNIIISFYWKGTLGLQLSLKMEAIRLGVAFTIDIGINYLPTTDAFWSSWSIWRTTLRSISNLGS
jgi:hypothetical protein